MRNTTKIKQELEILKQKFKIKHSDDFQRVVIKKFPLPQNFNRSKSDILLILSQNFPVTPPKLYIQNNCKIKFGNKKGYGYFHSFRSNSKLWDEGWAWLCFSHSWDSKEDGIISFLRRVDIKLPDIRADRNEID